MIVKHYNHTPIIRQLGCVDYVSTWQGMRDFTQMRTEETPDEWWCLEHFPVFTQGQAGKPEHILNPGSIPIVHTDRGGQVTYHGPGQLIIYCLVDLNRKNLGIRAWVNHLENSIIAMLANFGIKAHTILDAPGVYVEQAKIASLGLRVRRGCTYHGLALNVNMDLKPFTQINPCGYEKLPVCQTADISELQSIKQAADALLPFLTS